MLGNKLNYKSFQITDIGVSKSPWSNYLVNFSV